MDFLGTNNMKNTKELSNEEYNGIPFILSETIKKHVALEEKRWYNIGKPSLPKLNQSNRVVKDKVGWKNFFMSNVIQFKP